MGLVKTKHLTNFSSSGEIGVFAMVALVPENEQTWEEDHKEDNQHEQQGRF